MPWKKGQSGNPKGRPKRKVENTEHALLLDVFNDPARRAAIQAQVDRATEGDLASLQFLWTRVYGSTPKEVLIGNATEEPFMVGTLDLTDDRAREIAAEFLKATGGDVTALASDDEAT